MQAKRACERSNLFTLLREAWNGTALERRVVSREGSVLALRVHRLDDQVGAVLDALRSAGALVVDLHTRDPGLADVFLELTRGEAQP